MADYMSNFCYRQGENVAENLLLYAHFTALFSTEPELLSIEVYIVG